MGLRRIRSFFSGEDDGRGQLNALSDVLFRDEDMADMLPNDLISALTAQDMFGDVSLDCDLPLITADFEQSADCDETDVSDNDSVMDGADMSAGCPKKPLLDFAVAGPVVIPNDFLFSPPQDISTRRRAPSMSSDFSVDVIPAQAPCDAGKLTVVLDLDETLVYAREGPIIQRPQLDLLFEVLGERCETIVWTAGIKSYAQNICNEIDKRGVIRHCIYRHHKWFGPAAREKWFGCTNGGSYTKDLAILGRDMNRVLIIENTPTCVAANPENGIIVSDFTHSNPFDHTIPVIASLITQLLDSQMTVPQFLANCSLMRKQHLLMPNNSTMQMFFLDVQSALPTTVGDSEMGEAPFLGF
eukprot:TRINITY_DN1812_c0_g1_i1.p1 TRINITY_DN1812_c0_g1~~TRINITY_DN1812_c0_g1_i1.p1  ORF type:complete len:356 (-),score=50.87 TRINITY_DN1812_c0_g1_i1:628-1695(-)